MLLDQEMHNVLPEVWRHWSKPEEPRNCGAAAESDWDDNDFQYRPVRLPIVGAVRVRFTKAEPLRPMRYVLDDEDDE